MDSQASLSIRVLKVLGSGSKKNRVKRNAPESKLPKSCYAVYHMELFFFDSAAAPSGHVRTYLLEEKTFKLQEPNQTEEYRTEDFKEHIGRQIIDYINEVPNSSRRVAVRGYNKFMEFVLGLGLHIRERADDTITESINLSRGDNDSVNPDKFITYYPIVEGLQPVKKKGGKKGE